MEQPTSGNSQSGANGRPTKVWPVALSQHERWLRTVVRGRIGDLGAVDDVMQEVALAVVSQEPSVSDPSKVAPWLYRVAVRKTLMYRRRLGRRRKLRDRYVGERGAGETDASGVDPLQWILRNEIRESVRTALSQLSVGDREILTLKHTEGWSYQQLADHLGASLKTIEYRLLRARRRLRSRLMALGVEE